MISKKKRGRPVGTMRSAGYAVSTNGGGPRKTTELDGYLASKQGGRPVTKAKSEHEASGKATVKGMSVLFQSVLEDQLAQLKRKDMGLKGYGSSLTVCHSINVMLNCLISGIPAVRL